MNYLKPKTKYGMTPAMLNALCFLKLNGPPSSTVNINKYTQEYLRRPGNRLCDPPISQARRRSKEKDDDAPSSSAKQYSSLFVA